MTTMVEQELLDQTNVPVTPAGKYQMKDMVSIAYDLPDGQWDQLSISAQVWVNEAITAFNKDGTVPPFPDQPAPVPNVSPVTNGKDDGSISDAEVDATPQEPKPTQHKSAGRPKGSGAAKAATTRVKELMLELGPEVGAEIILARLHQEGFMLSRGTLDGIRAEFRSALKVLAERGMLKGS